MQAKVIHTHPTDGAETIAINGHEIQFGYGSGGDRFCNTHQSFKCIDNLTDEEREAIRQAE